jgi:CRISPR-associated endonuclease Cas1
MSVVYLVSNNGSLTMQNSVLLYEDYQGNTTKILPDSIDQICVIGRLSISGSAFQLLFKYKIDLCFLQKNGMYNGQLVYDESKNTIIRHTQHKKADDFSFSMSIAKSIVDGKLHNQYLFLQRIARKLPSNTCFESGLNEIKKIRALLIKSNNLDEVRGFEGAGAMIYFSLLGFNIYPEWAAFHGRNKNPPRDPVNATLSFLYTVLANRIESFIRMKGLDPGIGSLHVVSYGRNSLVYDLIEEFRTPIVDTLTCSLFNNGVLIPDDFRSCGDDGSIDCDEFVDEFGAVAVLLAESGVRKVIPQFEKKMKTEHYYPPKNKVVSFDAIIKEQVAQYKKVVSGELNRYCPMVIV